jgi:hypothetical protein
MCPNERRVWGVIVAFLLLTGLAGLLLPLALFPELRAHYDTIVDANEALLVADGALLWPDGGLPKAIVLVLFLPAVSLLLLPLDRAIAALFALRPPRGR